MLILRDTREQLPLKFDGLEGIEKVEDIALPYGDYTAMIKEKQVPVFFERKSLGDLFGTMTSGYERFRKEMERCAANKHKLILCIEGSYGAVLNGFAHSEFSGDSMVKKLAMLYTKYDLESWYCESRSVMIRRIYETFSAIERYWKKEGK